MIAYLQGNVIPNTEDTVIINARGVGYEVFVSQNTHRVVADLPSAQLWIHTSVREDAILLFGFHAKAEKDLFLSLIKVNGIGPKVAMKILSGASLEAIVRMIDEGDVRGLSQLPKVGKKTAEQIILELKGKLVLAGETAAARPQSSTRSDIVSALVNLGFKLQDVEKAVDRLEPGTELEDGIRRGLGMLSAQF